MAELIRNLLPLTLLQFGILGISGSNSTSFCKTLSPVHNFNPEDATLRKCYFPLGAQVGETCEIGKQDLNVYPRCVNHAKCIQDPRRGREVSPRGICLCKDGFKETSFFTCDRIKRENENCQLWPGQSEYGPNFYTDDCDIAKGHKCSDGICQCHERAVDGVCILPAKQLCRLDQTGLKSTARCDQNSRCVKYSNDFDYGICTCDEGYSAGRSRECKKSAAFGESCGESTEQSCDEIAGLRCNSGTCSCDLPSQGSERICGIRIGKRCKAGPNQASCPTNAACVNGTCECNDGFLEDDDGGGCKLLVQLGGVCDEYSTRTTTRCDPTSGLTCRRGKCNCARELSSDKKSCIAYILDKCGLKTPRVICPANSSCTRQRYSLPNSTVGKCDCLDGFSLSWLDRDCHQLLGKGETCTEGRYQLDDFCNKNLGLSCKFSVCACVNRESDDGRCKLKVDDPCTSSGQHTSICAPNSKCEGNGEDLTCKCERGLISTNDKSRCVPQKGYLETCGKAESICPKDLLCLRGRCQCSEPDKFVFDPEVKDCRSKGVCEGDSDCPTRSTCQPLYGGSSTKRCKCTDGYSLDHQSLCKSNYMSSCSFSSDCLASKSMGCVEGVCRCIAPLNQIYNSKMEECVGLVGSPCDTRNKRCMESAFCDTDGVCRCVSGAVTSRDGKCAQFLDFGENCSQEGSGYCNRAKGLACVDGICACVDPYLEYLADQGTCVGKLGSICGLKIPLGNCLEEKAGPFRFSRCNNYEIRCGRQLSCKETDIGGINRCLA